MNVLIRKETAPHIRRHDSLFRMLLDVIIGLAPVSIMAMVAYTWRYLAILLISVGTMVASEIVFVLIKNRVPYDGQKHTIKEHLKKGFAALNVVNILAPMVSGMIFAMITPSSSDPGPVIYVAAFVGALFGMVIGKLVFGGTGQNIFNPAALGMVFAKICFGSHYVYDGTYYVTNVSTTGTVLTSANKVLVEGLPDFLAHYEGINNAPILDMFLGRVPGVMGEGFKFAILIGLIYLLIRKAIDPRVIISFLGTFVLLVGVAGIFVATRVTDASYGMFLLFELCSGGMLFGMTYMLTDPVTMPINAPGRVMYGCLAAILTVFIRLFGAYPEGMAFAILFCNMLAPVLDYHAWSSSQFTKKKIIILSSIIALALLIICLAFGLGGKL